MNGTSRARYPRAVVIPVLVIALVGLVAMFWRPGSSASVGDRMSGGRVLGEAMTSYAPMPYGSMRLSVTKGRVAQLDDSKRELGDGAEWVQVSWDPSVAPDDAQTTVWPGATREDLNEPPSRIILRADGTDHVLASQITSADGAGSAILAVDSPDELAVLVSTAGGPARPTEARPITAQVGSPDIHTCESQPRQAAGEHGFRYEVDCLFQTTRALYVPGLGLAPKGKSWLVVRDARILQDRFPNTPPSVGHWEDGKEHVSYQASGRPSLRLEVSGVGRPTKTVGRDTLTTVDPRLAMRAYLVPAEKPATVTMHYTTAAKPAPGEGPVAGAPAKKAVSVHAAVRMPR